MSSLRETFLRAYNDVDMRQRRMKTIGHTDVFRGYTSELVSQNWDIRPTIIYEDINSNVVEFNVDIRYGVDLWNMDFS